MADRQSRSPRLRHGAWIAVPLLVAIAAGAWIAWHQEDGIDAITSPTLVVLPLQPAGSGHDEGVLAEGLSAEWIAPLAHIQGLRVIAGASALRARVEHLNSKQPRARLGATHVLTGQLHDSGSEVRIDLQLRTCSTTGACTAGRASAMPKVMAWSAANS